MTKQKYRYTCVVQGQWNITEHYGKKKYDFNLLKPSYKTENEVKTALKELREKEGVI
jgi:hypothetical protein